MLEELTSSMGQRKQDLRDILQLMGLFALQPSVALSQIPSPAKSQPECGGIFVDPDNMGRSKDVEGYTKLVWEWTVRTGGQWRDKVCAFRMYEDSGPRRLRRDTGKVEAICSNQ
jgi:hypothetical protein